MKVAVLGMWHLGGVVSSCLAKLGHSVVGIDADQKTIDNLNNGVPPLDEPDLSSMIAECMEAGRLSWSTDMKNAEDCDVVILAFDTPVDDKDMSDTQILFDAVDLLTPVIKENALFLVTSQVPVTTTRALYAQMKATRPELHCSLAYMPENLRLGEAVDCFLNPDRIILGVETEEGKDRLEELFDGISCPRMYMGIESAEMTKHALNAFLATSLSYTYNISDICERVGADVTHVMKALKSDTRIGSRAYLDTSLGFSGGTLMRDLKTLHNIAIEKDVNISVVDSVIETNETRRGYLCEELLRILNKDSLNDTTIGVLGVTYKPNTSTLRRSLSIELMKLLEDRGARLKAYDPGADADEFLKETGHALSADPYEMADDCQVIVAMTPWKDFLDLDIGRLRDHMKTPCFFIDTRNFLRHRESEFTDKNFAYYCVGRGNEMVAR